MHQQFKTYGEIIKVVLEAGEDEGNLDIRDMDITTRAVLSFCRDIGALSMMEDKTDEVVNREIDLMLDLLFTGILSREEKSP